MAERWRQCHRCGRIAEPDHMVDDGSSEGWFVCARWDKEGCRYDLRYA